jgi:hypothetical protein
MSPIVQVLIQSTPRYILASVFLLAAQARLTDRLNPTFHEHETSKTLRTLQNSWLRVSPWLHQRIVGIPVGLVGLGLLVPQSLLENQSEFSSCSIRLPREAVLLRYQFAVTPAYLVRLLVNKEPLCRLQMQMAPLPRNWYSTFKVAR